MVILLGLLTSFFPISESNDDWWHLKAGQMLWEGELGWYSTDPFTESARDKVWINHEWLAECLFYAATDLGGLRLAILLKSFILVLVFGVVYASILRTSPQHQGGISFDLAAALAVALAIPCSQFTFYLRPPIFTFLFLAVYHHFFLKNKGGPPSLREGALLAGLMTLWANLHGGAILGCVVIFLLGLGSLLDYGLSPGLNTEENKKRIRRWIYFGIAVGIASLLNPYGPHLHLLTFEMMSQKWLTERISEMLPPRIDFIWTLPLLLIPAALGVIRYGNWGARLVFLFLLWQGLSHVRHLPLLSIWAAPYAGMVFAHRLRRPGVPFLVGILCLPMVIWMNTHFQILPHAWLANAFFRWGVVVALVGIAVGTLWKPKTMSRLFIGVCLLSIGYVVVYPGNRPVQFLQAVKGTTWERGNYPNQLIDLIEKYDIPGQILLNRENYSGYIIWRLAPERMRTFTCNRFDLQGSLPRMELETILWCVPMAWVDEASGIEVKPWRELWDGKYRFDAVILEKYSDREEPYPFPLWDYLQTPESGFVLLASETFPGQRFSDQIFSLFVRKGAHLEKVMKELKTRPLLRD